MSPAKIFLFFLIFFIFGIGLASFAPVSFFIPCFLFAIVAGAVICSLNKTKTKLILFCLLAMALGLGRYKISIPRLGPEDISFYQEEEIIFRAKIVERPVEKMDKIQLTVEAQELAGRSVRGRVLITLPLITEQNYHYGDLLRVEGKLYPPQDFPAFSYTNYLARYEIYSLCYYPQIKIIARDQGNFFFAGLNKLKNKVKDKIDLYFTQPQGAVIAALLLGLKNELPDFLRDQFARAGLAHLLAISGLHITILCLILSAFWTSVLVINRRQAFYLTAALVVLFVILAGIPASAVRAAIMGLSLAYAGTIGRPGSSWRILLMAAALMLAINPYLLKADVGFQLSFLAVLGISLFNDGFERFFRWVPNQDYWPLRSYLAISLSAQVLTLPLVFYKFGTLSLIAPLSNILVLPFLPLAMGISFLFFLASLIGLGQIFIWPAWVVITYLSLVARVAAQIPWFSFSLRKVNLIVPFFLYLLVGFFLLFLEWRKKGRFGE